MKYLDIIKKIQTSTFSREQLRTLRDNAEKQLQKGDTNAKSVIDEIDRATPTDRHIVFMGFCPGADFNNRQDVEWKEKNICTFDYYDSEHQLERFNDICAGDLIVLKKRHEFGKTMKLYGHGRVVGVQYDADERRFLQMEWSNQNDVIEVPLMGCNSTVDVRPIEQVESEVPELFDWLKSN